MIPSQAKSIVDVTGAGDAATAGLVQGLLQNLPLDKAAALGQAMAARVIASDLSTLE
jgi:sugar/nucleoside kinase (ribokinase family)